MISLNRNQVLVIGGWTYGVENQRHLIDSIDIYDYELGTWKHETKIPTPRFHSGVALVGDKLHIVGGFHSDVTFDRATGMSIYPIFYATVSNGNRYFFTFHFLGLVEIYDLKTKTWNHDSKSYPEDIWEHACVALHIPSCRTEDSYALDQQNKRFSLLFLEIVSITSRCRNL